MAEFNEHFEPPFHNATAAHLLPMTTCMKQATMKPQRCGRPCRQYPVPPASCPTKSAGSVRTCHRLPRSVHGEDQTGLFLIGMMLVLGVLGGCVELPSAEPKTTTALAVVLDTSHSTGADRCAELEVVITESATLPGPKRIDLLVLSTGTEDSAGEPRVLIPPRRWEPSVDLFEEPDAIEAARVRWTQQVISDCNTLIQGSGVSPVYAAVKRAVDSLSARCMNLEQRGERCLRRILSVHSDLRETFEDSIRRRLLQTGQPRAGKSKRHARTVAVPTVDIDGVELRICGVSDTKAHSKKSRLPVEAVATVWSEVFGTPIQLSASCAGSSLTATANRRPK